MNRTSWIATKPQGMAGAGSRPCAGTGSWAVAGDMRMRQMHQMHQHTQKQTPFAAFGLTTKPAAGAAAVYGTGVSINRAERPEGLRGRAG